MSYHDRVKGQFDVPLLSTKYVVVVGVGTVGAPVALHLAQNGVGYFIFVDGDIYEEVNRVRHILPSTYRGQNKAVAMRAHLLSEEIPTFHADSIPHYVDESMTDGGLDRLLEPADLIIAGTGEREVQRRLARRALALDIPTVLPALYPDGGGEVFLQTSPQRPCFFCWDGWRSRGEPVRGAEAPAVDAMPVIQTAIELSLGILDPNSQYDELTIPDENELDQTRRQLFMLLPEASRETWPIQRQRDCPSCTVGPSPLNPGARQAWEEARNRTRTRTTSTPIVRPTRLATRPIHTEPTVTATNAVEDFFHLIGQVVSGTIQIVVASGLAFVWIWFWSEDFNVMWNPVIWIGLIFGLAGLRNILTGG